jgi:hypothetical protein
MTTSDIPSLPPPLPRRERFKFEPISGPPGPLLFLENLLKHPGRILYELESGQQKTLAVWLLVLGLGGMAVYGLVVGSLAGGAQLWIAPAKLALGTLLSVLICLPSLYIFSCLGGSDARPGAVAGLLAAVVCLGALLLVGFAPVAWIFSQSTDSAAFMGALHLLFWLIGLFFGLRLLGGMSRLRGESGRAHLRIWAAIFILVCLQMTTTLRPLLGRSEHLLPDEKKFFVSHWVDCLGGKR